jgi:hypothetical protein
MSSLKSTVGLFETVELGFAVDSPAISIKHTIKIANHSSFDSYLVHPEEIL